MCLDERWKKTVDDGRTNKAWDAYDNVIQEEVNDYNTRFAKTPGYAQVDWKLLKAMLWTESGGPTNLGWRSRPMQIGNPGDKGYAALKNGIEGSSGSEGADIIMSAELKNTLKNGNISTPALNVRAGIAYVFTRMVMTEFQSVYQSSDPTPLKHIVKSGESLDVIAKKVGSTLEVMQKLNGNKVLHVGDTVLYRKANTQRVIIGWRSFTTQGLADRYNTGGDPCYKQKLDYVLALFKK